MNRMGLLGAMVSVSLFLAVGGSSAAVAGAAGQPACDCCAKGRQPASTAPAAKDPEGIAACKYCGMDRGKFASSRMLVEYEDGSSLGTCSIHCMAVEMVNSIDRTPVAIKVGDFGSGKLIDAEAAFWVVGGTKPGVMSSRAKWAFEKKSDAETFVAANGGVLASFDDAVKAAYEDMYKDIKQIRDRRKMKRMQQTGSK